MFAVYVAHCGFFVTQVLITAGTDATAFALLTLALCDESSAATSALNALLAVFCSKVAVAFGVGKG